MNTQPPEYVIDYSVLTTWLGGFAGLVILVGLVALFFLTILAPYYIYRQYCAQRVTNELLTRVLAALQARR
jgi:hypothetical protein